MGLLALNAKFNEVTETQCEYIFSSPSNIVTPHAMIPTILAVPKIQCVTSQSTVREHNSFSTIYMNNI